MIGEETFEKIRELTKHCGKMMLTADRNEVGIDAKEGREFCHKV